LKLARWSLAVLMGSGLLWACQRSPQIQAVSGVPSFLLTSYLYTEDPQEATRLLEKLLDYPMPELMSALKAPRHYPAAPTGRLPEQTILVNGVENVYGLYVPKDYQPTQAYPLILCLHGAGFDGDSYLDRWQPRLGEHYLLACPSFEEAAWWTQEAEALVLAVYGEVTRNYHVDLDRVFLTGMSNGGIGTYLIGLNHTDLFAALIPMAGALPGPLMTLLDNARTTPFYLIHGAKDQIIPSKYSQAVDDYLLKRGYSVVYREHHQVHPMAGGHFFPREELPALIDWLAKQRRIPAPRQITIVRDRDHPGRDYWIRIEEIGPEVGSFWASEEDPEETKRLAEGLYARMEARIGQDNLIEITTQHVRRYTVLLNNRLVDLKRPVRIVTNGQVSFEGMAAPDPGVLLEGARRRPDPENLVSAAIDIVVK
jgi:pimeloyl-ACP methyl ester carboxylesterase